jgi:rhodanese-related sulfurtransferase
MTYGHKGIATYYRLHINEAFEMFNLNDPNIVFLDVREEQNRVNGTIPNSIHNTLEDMDQDFFDTLDKSKSYILFCFYGGRSSVACESMAQHGFDKVYNLEGGWLEWESSDYPIQEI